MSDIIEDYVNQRHKLQFHDGPYMRGLQNSLKVEIDPGYVMDNNASPKSLAASSEAKEKDDSLSEDELLDISTPEGARWAKSSRAIYDRFTAGRTSGGRNTRFAEKGPKTDQEYARWGVEFMGQFNYNMTKMAADYIKLRDMDEETAVNMVALMGMYDQLPNFTWNGTKRMLSGLLTDPTTYAGLGTLGLGFVGRQGTKQMTKKSFQNVLMSKIKNPYVIAALEGGAYGALDNALRQGVEIESGLREGVDLGSVAGSAAVGAAAGPALVGAIDAAPTIARTVGDRLSQRGEMPTVGSNLGNVFGPKNNIISEGGLPILQEKGDENLRLHSNRISAMSEGNAYPGAPKNPRTVIKAPKDSNLPDVVVGNIKPDDWQNRIESAMTPDQISKAATWYKNVFGEFQNQADGDPVEIARLTDAWFAGQQNSSPGQTLNDVLFVYEQVKRGVPKDQLKGKGLPSANKIVIDILTQSEITGGAGQKIADFLDSGYGKNVRAIMGNKPEGGSPFVVDIHTGRDTGLVDQIYINHLNRLGYDVPKDLIVDLGGGGIKGAQYENRALFGQELTQHLNDQNWMGRSDWEPAEIQAIGWMQLSSMYGTPNVGGDIQDAFTTNTRRISMESDPGEGSPFAEKFGKDLANLSDVQLKNINDKVTSKAIELVNKELGITLGTNVHGTGGWELFQNPSTVQQAIASKDAAIEAGARLGYLLQQTEVWVNAPKAITKNPKDFMIDIVETNGSSLRDSERLKDLFEQIMEKDPDGLFKGYQPIIQNGQPGIRIIIPYSTISASAKEAKKQNRKIKVQDLLDKVQSFANTELGQITDNLNFDAKVSIMEADLTVLGNNWTKDKTGGGYKSYFSGQSGQDATREGTVSGLLDNDATELEKFFAATIEEAQGK